MIRVALPPTRVRKRRTRRCSEQAGAVRVESKIESQWRLLPVAGLCVMKMDGKRPKYLTPAIVLFGAAVLLLALIYPHSSRLQKFGTNNPIDWAASYDGYSGAKVIYFRRDRPLRSSRGLDCVFASMDWINRNSYRVGIRKRLIDVAPYHLNNATNVLFVAASLTNSVDSPDAWLVEPGGTRHHFGLFRPFVKTPNGVKLQYVVTKYPPPPKGSVVEFIGWESKEVIARLQL